MCIRDSLLLLWGIKKTYVELFPIDLPYLLITLYLLSFFFMTNDTVSYTHLDVYKRQVKILCDCY